MYLDRVQLENFGIYQRRTLELGGAPIVLLYGPNESGKTTALNGLRQAMFGFKPRSVYLTAGKTMSAEVIGSLADNRGLRFTRRKGKQDEVVGTVADRRVDAASICKLLGNLDLASYEQLFGFSLDELRAGEEALKSAKLSEALAGGGISGINALQRLRVELQESLGSMYKPTGSKSLINVKLTEINDLKTSLAKVQVTPSEVEELQRMQSQLQQQGERLRGEHYALGQNLFRTKRLMQSLPYFRKLIQLQKQLATIDLPEGVDMQFLANWREHADRRKLLAAKLQEEESSLAQEQQQIENLNSDAGLFEHEELIEQLGHQVESVSALRSRLIDMEDSLADATLICRRVCESLQLPEVTAAIRDFKVSAPERRELERVAREMASIADAQIANRAQLATATRALQSLQPNDQLETLPQDLDYLTSQVEQLDDAEQRLALAAQRLQQLVDDAAAGDLEQRLMQTCGTMLYSDWILPSTDVIQQASSVRIGLTSQLAQLALEISSIDEEISASAAQLESVDQAAVERLLEQLHENHRQRDQYLQNWVDDLRQPLIASGLSTELQLERLAQLQELASQSDQLHAALMESSETVAKYQAGQKQIQKMLDKQQLLQEQHQAVQSQLTQWDHDWQALWHSNGIVAQAPNQMLAWTAEFARWRDNQRQQTAARREVHLARSVVRSLRTALVDLWPDVMRDDTATGVMRTRLEAWRNAARDAQRDTGRLQSARQQVSQLEAESVTLADTAQSLMEQYNRWLTTAPIQIAWPVEDALQLVDAIEHLRREDETCRRYANELTTAHRRLKEFDAQAIALAEQLSAKVPPNMAVELWVQGWFEELKRQREQRAQQIRLSSSLEHRQHRIVELTEQKVSLEQRLAALVASSGTAGELGLGSLVEMVQRTEQLRADIAECHAALEAQANGLALEQLLNQLAEADEVELQLAMVEFDRQIQQVDQQRKECDQQIGSLQERIEQIAKSEQAGKLAMQLHHQRGQLSDLCEQWAVHRLAAELLDRAVEKFSAENEPVLLQHTRQFLQQLTGGRYQSVDHDSASPGSFAVLNSNGDKLDPTHLSTGTREQLYLSIRMAFITHYCDMHEPLPVIMDDCFVNFDDMRTAYALRAIAQWPINAQRILLSCHFRVVQSLAEFAPETPCIHLERDERTTVGELANEFNWAR